MVLRSLPAGWPITERRASWRGFFRPAVTALSLRERSGRCSVRTKLRAKTRSSTGERVSPGVCPSPVRWFKDRPTNARHTASVGPANGLQLAAAEIMEEIRRAALDAGLRPPEERSGCAGPTRRTSRPPAHTGVATGSQITPASRSNAAPMASTVFVTSVSV